MTFHKIFTAIDHSELSEEVLLKAFDLAKLSQASLKLFHCLSTHTLGEPPIPLPVDLGLNAELITQAYETEQWQLEEALKEGEFLLKSYGERAQQEGIIPELQQKVAVEAGPIICEEAQSWGADLIILGRRGRSGLAEMVLGSVSNYVVHHAHCCVLVVQV